MYFKCGTDYADGDMALLTDLLAILDKEILQIQEQIKGSKDPESDGLLDRGEYLVGVGITAIQQYLVDTLTLTDIDKKTVLQLGPKYSENYSIVQVINSVANYWKHSAEWCSGTELRKDAQRTIQVVSEVAGTNDYLLYNSLYALLRGSDVTLCSLLPTLVLWRTTVDEERQRDS